MKEDRDRMAMSSSISTDVLRQTRGLFSQQISGKNTRKSIGEMSIHKNILSLQPNLA